MKVLEILAIIFIVIGALYYAFVIAAIVYCGIIEPIHKAVKKIARALRERQNKEVNAM